MTMLSWEFSDLRWLGERCLAEAGLPVTVHWLEEVIDTRESCEPVGAAVRLNIGVPSAEFVAMEFGVRVAL